MFYYVIMSHQDWETVIFRKKPQRYGNTEQDINKARRNDNLHIETHLKPKGQGQAQNLRKLDADAEDFHHKLVPTDVAKAIDKARLTKQLTQDALARALNMQGRQINDIEKGRAIYDGPTLSKIKRYLGI